MSNQTVTSDDNPFDVGRIRQLVRLMRDNDLSEIDLRWVDARIRLRRGADPVVTSVHPMAYSGGVAAAVTPVSGQPAAESIPKPPEYKTINSPIVGTFYAASGPDAERFVSVGTKVTPESTVCIIEAMKVFNEIPSGITGTIREILIEDGTPVEYGTPLFHVDPA